MNTKISIAAISIFLVLVIGASADAQLSDSDLRARSRHYTNQLGQLREFPSTSVVMRGGFPGGVQTSTISVQSGEVVVRLDSEGTLRGYSDLGDSRTEPSRGTERFSSNEQVWSFVERLLPALDAPSDLTRVKIERRGGDGSGKPTFLLRFEQRPFGYKAQAGNIVSCFVHRITGRILELHIGRGWTYEAPNIQIDAGTAKASAATTLGGNASDWNYVLEYDTSPDTATAPQIRELNGRKIMRLCFEINFLYLSSGVIKRAKTLCIGMS